ncbi:MAG TPA: LamG domain-containing protein, partial [Chitinophagaceae bacterium]|nr:LamG domain-containing protein [Chitinophagaceae bacterium]
MKVLTKGVILLLCIVFFDPSIYSQVDLANGLIAHYPFDGNANDVSGNNINGVVNNATLTTDRNGQVNSAYYFDGASYIQLPYSSLYDFKPNDSFSISVRVLPDQGYSWPAQALVVKSPYSADFNTSDWNYGAYLLNYKAMTGYAYNSVLTGTTVFTGTPCWYNIVATYKNGVWRLYVNGVLESSDLTQTKFILQDGPSSKIAFGRKGEASGDYYKGKMDDIRIYHRVLNQDEIGILSECTIKNIGNIINAYTPVLDFKDCENKITVEDASSFNIG